MTAGARIGALLLAASLVIAPASAQHMTPQESPGQVTVAPTEAAPARGLDDETKCLALSVYWEGKTESRKGQLAVAHTVLNRIKHPKFPDTVCGVVSQRADAGRGRCQFSWWCDGKRDEPKADADWAEAVEVAQAAMKGEDKDPTNGALYFHSARIKPPKWTISRKKLARIGNHVFYR